MNEEDNKKYEMIKQCTDKLNRILCSYSGPGHQSVYIDMDSLVLFVGLIMGGEIKLQEFQYNYNPDIYEDETAVHIYEKLAPQTNWRLHSRTQIEPIRMNALKQIAHLGTPVYEGNIYYGDTECILICGEILPYEIIQLLTSPQKVNQIYVFSYPYRQENEKNVYYSFDFTEMAREEMKRYMNRIFEKIRGIM